MSEPEDALWKGENVPPRRRVVFDAPPDAVKLDRVPLDPVHAFLDGPQEAVFGVDPRRPEQERVFTAWPVEEGDAEVLDVATFPANIAPGTSMSTTITLDGFHDHLSVAGMLVTTNDAFFGLDSVTDMRHSDGRTFFAPVFDAGTEFNSEDCMYIPGPPCGNGGSHDPRADVGFVHFSNGIHGIGSLDAPTYDWGAYAARIEVRRL